MAAHQLGQRPRDPAPEFARGLRTWATMGCVGVLDVERVRAELGPRLADRFLQYATAPEPDEAQRLLFHVDEHMVLMARRGGADPERGKALASRCKHLLLRYFDASPEVRAAIAGAVRYFIDTHDMDRDDGPLGFVDDAQVMNYVIRAVAPDLEPVMIP
jgi:hypothetical protein